MWAEWSVKNFSSALHAFNNYSALGSIFSSPLHAHWYQKHHSAFAPRLKHFSMFKIPTVRIYKNENNRRVSTWLIGTLVFKLFFLPHDKLWLSALKVIIAAFCCVNFVCDEKQNSTLFRQLFYLWIDVFLTDLCSFEIRYKWSNAVRLFVWMHNWESDFVWSVVVLD